MDRPEMEARSAKFAREVAEFANRLRGRPGGTNAADQLADCSSSTAANYRAAGRARSRKEFVSKLGIANEEADETVYWLELVRAADIHCGADLGWLLDEANELSRIFNQSQMTAKASAAQRRA